MNIYEEIGLKSVINASGKMTALGVSTLNEEVSNYMIEAASRFVKIDQLIDRVGELISEHTGGEDSCVTTGAAAGISIATAACIAQDNQSAIEHLPLSKGLPNEVVIQKGHGVNFGAPITQMIQLGGGVPVEVGQTNQVLPQHIEEGINENTAALLYVKSHHTVQKGMSSINDMAQIAKKHGIPLIVDAAAEENLTQYVKLGADLVIYSGGKAIEGPTSGFITGNKEYIPYCKLQYQGIGRAMKIGKENMMGLVKALELYNTSNKESEISHQKEQMEWLVKEINQLKGLEASLSQDEAGREIYRTKVHVNSNNFGMSATQLVEALENGNPAIYTRNHLVNTGVIAIDPRPLNLGDEQIILERLKDLSGKT